ncbi:Retrovirus-related Pol polyprotein from transposon TNT 1-94 [Linum perenne]
MVSGMFVTLPTGTRVQVSHIGFLRVGTEIVVVGVLVIPDFQFNLLSVSKLTCSNAYSLTFSSGACLIYVLPSLRTIGIAKKIGELYCFTQSPVSSSGPSIHSNAFSVFKHFDLWHFRLGHCSSTPQALALGRPSSDFHCTICPVAKQKRLNFPLSDSCAENWFELAHMDIWGPYSVPTLAGHIYFLTVVDDKSRFTWIYHMSHKSEARDLLIQFWAVVRAQFSLFVKIVRTDNGG